MFSSILQIWYIEVRISRSISEGPLHFQITRDDCTSNYCPIFDTVDQGKSKTQDQWYEPASVAQLDAHPTGDQEVAGSTPPPPPPPLGQQYSVVETDHGIFSAVILSLPLIQEGQLSVSRKRKCSWYWLTT